MSVRAYLIKYLKINSDETTIKIEKILEKTATFDLTHNEKIFKIFQENEGDHTSSDLNGEIAIDKISWNRFLLNLNKEKYSQEELDIIDKITNDLKNKEIIYYECF